jgi:hypothetical protein
MTSETNTAGLLAYLQTQNPNDDIVFRDMLTNGEERVMKISELIMLLSTPPKQVS